MNWFRNFMYGRYGVDHLTIALLVVSFALTAISSLFRVPLIGFLSYIPLIFSLFRILSKNITGRRKENDKFLSYWLPLSRKARAAYSRLKDRNHKYFKCPNCKSTLRVPKGKGNITVICPKCKHETKKKS